MKKWAIVHVIIQMSINIQRSLWLIKVSNRLWTTYKARRSLRMRDKSEKSHVEFGTLFCTYAKCGCCCG